VWEEVQHALELCLIGTGLQRNGEGGELKNDLALPNWDQMGQEQALSVVKRLTEWLEKGMQN
jgi:hypothetical protein